MSVSVRRGLIAGLGAAVALLAPQMASAAPGISACRPTTSVWVSSPTTTTLRLCGPWRNVVAKIRVGKHRISGDMNPGGWRIPLIVRVGGKEARLTPTRAGYWFSAPRPPGKKVRVSIARPGKTDPPPLGCVTGGGAWGPRDGRMVASVGLAYCLQPLSRLRLTVTLERNGVVLDRNELDLRAPISLPVTLEASAPGCIEGPYQSRTTILAEAVGFGPFDGGGYGSAYVTCPTAEAE